MSFDKLLEYGAMLDENILGSGWSLIQFAGKRYWLHMRTKTILASTSQVERKVS